MIVECYSGSVYAEAPRAFFWEGERLEVESILARWRSPQGREFRVRVTDGRTFRLLYLEDQDLWQIDLT